MRFELTAYALLMGFFLIVCYRKKQCEARWAIFKKHQKAIWKIFLLDSYSATPKQTIFLVHRDSVVPANEALQKTLQSTEVKPLIEANCNNIIHRSLSSILNYCSKLVFKTGNEISVSSKQFEVSLSRVNLGGHFMGKCVELPRLFILLLQSPLRGNKTLFGKTYIPSTFGKLTAEPITIWITLSKTLKWIAPKVLLDLLDSIFSDLSLKKTQHRKSWMSNSLTHPPHNRLNSCLFCFFKSSNSFFYALQC